MDEKPIHTLSMSGMGTLPGPPLAGLASLGLGPPPQKDWDQMSMYSQRTDRSVPRARMYHAGKKIEKEIQLVLHLRGGDNFEMTA